MSTAASSLLTQFSLADDDRNAHGVASVSASNPGSISDASKAGQPVDDATGHATAMRGWGGAKTPV